MPSPGNLPDPGIEPWSPASWADALPSEPPGKSAVQNADPDETQLGGLPMQQMTVAGEEPCPPALAPGSCPGPRFLSAGLGWALSARCRSCALLPCPPAHHHLTAHPVLLASLNTGLPQTPGSLPFIAPGAPGIPASPHPCLTHPTARTTASLFLHKLQHMPWCVSKK